MSEGHLPHPERNDQLHRCVERYEAMRRQNTTFFFDVEEFEIIIEHYLEQSDARRAREVLDLAPDAGTPGMREQFDCHWTWARVLEPDKPTWNLEPWRPPVGADLMAAEGCNPGGPEV